MWLHSLMKNTPKVGLVSNFWGAVHYAGFFLGDCNQASEPGQVCGLLANGQRARLRGQPGRHVFDVLLGQLGGKSTHDRVFATISLHRRAAGAALLSDARVTAHRPVSA